MRLLAPLLVFLCSLDAVAADYIVTSRGIWRVDDGQPVKITGPNDRVELFGVDSPDTPPPPPPPPPGSIVEQVMQITKETVRPGKEAEGLVAVIRMLKRRDVNPDKLKLGLEMAVKTLSSATLFPGNRFDEWLKRVQALDPAYTKLLMEQLDEAVSRTFNLPPGAMETKEDIEKISLIDLIELLQLIFEMLKKWGVLDQAAGFALASSYSVGTVASAASLVRLLT